MPLVISDKRVLLINHEIFTKTITDPDGKSQTVTDCKELDRVSLEPGVQKQVADWVIDNDHFKMLLADGAASAM